VQGHHALASAVLQAFGVHTEIHRPILGAVTEPSGQAREAERRRAVMFGAEAERYDRARPSYPTALIDDLDSSGPERVLDVGCGTGKAGRLLAD